MSKDFIEYSQREGWVFYKDKELGRRVYRHSDGYKITSRGGVWVYLNGAMKGWPSRGRLVWAMETCEKYGMVGYREKAETELREELASLSVDALEIAKTLVIQDGVLLSLAIPMAKALSV